MATHKLLYDDEMEDPFSLVAIHCSEEDYKLAYLLNQFLNTKFKRSKKDLDFSSDGKIILFPLYAYEDLKDYNSFYLVANKCKMMEASLQSSGGLFSESVSEKATTHYLLPEMKNVDYFLKIQTDYGNFPIESLISEINKIKQIISAYFVETEKIKSKNNLIFD